jgi:hypothetical protein
VFKIPDSIASRHIVPGGESYCGLKPIALQNNDNPLIS